MRFNNNNISASATTDSKAYRIRPYREDDRYKLEQLVDEVMPNLGPSGLTDRWWWHHEPPPIMLAETDDGSSIVGLCSAMPFSLFNAGKYYDGGWVVDFHISPQHQRKGVGSRITAYWMDHLEVAATLQHSNAAWATFKKAGWAQRWFFPRCVSPFSLLPGFRSLVGLLKKRRNTGIECNRITGPEVFDESFDGLWNRLKDSLGPVVVRNREALQKRYAGFRSGRYELLTCHQHGELCGYMILRNLARGEFLSLRRFRVGAIVDFLADIDDTEVFGDLLEYAIIRMMDTGAQLLFCMTSVPGFIDILAGHGFFHPGLPLIGNHLNRLYTTFTFFSREHGATLDHRPWYLTMGDCDVEPC